MIKKAILSTSVSAMVLFAGNAIASEQMSMAEIQSQLQQLSAQVQMLSNVVEQQNNIIEQQKIALEKQQQTTNEAIANIQPAAGNVVGDVKISMKPMPKIESLDGKYSFQPFGRIHLDSTQFNDDKKDHANNTNFRRARLGVKGKLGEDFSYKTEIDFAEENVNIKEAAITYTGFDFADIKIGNHKPSFGMEQNTSSNYMMFIERAAPTNAFTRSEILGVNIFGGGDNWSWAAGLFNEDAGNDDTGEDEDVSVDLKTSINALGFINPNTNNVIHLGAGISHRRPTGNVRFKAKPAGDGDNIIDTGNITSVDDVNIYNIQAAAIFGPFSFQSEYFKTDISRSNGNTGASFNGYYAQAGLFLTGETRPYKGKSGKFSRVKPKSPFDLKNGGTGAWEILARYESADLNDASAGILGGSLDNYAIGVNWHLNDRMRLMANVIDVDTDNNAVVADDDPTIFNLRAQWDF